MHAGREIEKAMTCGQKGDYEAQLQSLEQAAQLTKSMVKKSYFYYYMAMRCWERMRYNNHIKEDTLLKEKGDKYLEEALQFYPNNYEALVYLSKHAEPKSKEAELSEKAKNALPMYDRDAERDHLYNTIRLLAMFDPYNK
jgi:hypothetical protein